MVDRIQFERLFKALDAERRRVNVRLLLPIEQARDHQAGNDQQNGHDQHNFNQRHAAW